MNYRDHDNDSENLKLVVTPAEPINQESVCFTSKNSSLPLSLSVSTNFENTVPIDLAFYKQSMGKPNYQEKDILETYAILESNDVTSHLSTNQHITIVSDALINKITLLDFSIGHYTLSLNGQNVSTARLNFTTQRFEFDLNLKPSQTLDHYKEVSVCLFEPVIENRKDYLNLGRIDKINIFGSKNLKLNKYHTIRLHGYFLIDDKWIETNKDITVYPHDTHTLNIYQPTESLDISIEGNGAIFMKINGHSYGDLLLHQNHLQKNQNQLRIKFKNSQRILEGEQNRFLSDEINKNVINMSRIHDVTFITLNCKIINITQHCYGIYTYPERRRVFCN